MTTEENFNEGLQPGEDAGDEFQRRSVFAGVSTKFLHLPPSTSKSKKGRALLDWEWTRLKELFGDIHPTWHSAIKKTLKGKSLDPEGGGEAGSDAAGDNAHFFILPRDGRDCERRSVKYKNAPIFNKGPPAASSSLEMSRMTGEVASTCFVLLISQFVYSFVEMCSTRQRTSSLIT